MAETGVVDELHDLCDRLNDHPNKFQGRIAIEQYRLRGLDIATYAISRDEKEDLIAQERLVLLGKLKDLLKSPETSLSPGSLSS